MSRTDKPYREYMPETLLTENIPNPSDIVLSLLHRLAHVVEGKMDRNAFFQILAVQLKQIFHYDRFCINLYDAQREFLNLFTAPDGTVIESLSNTRVARNTIAAKAISSRKPVVIKDILAQNLIEGTMPLSSVGLNATIALPLIFNQEVFATLHVSFVRPPDNMIEILNLLLDLRPIVTTFLAAILAQEKSERTQSHRRKQTKLCEDNSAGLESRLLETRCMQKTMHIAAKVAKINIPVIITGETGTGKSMLARWLHNHSPRQHENFVHVNCPSLAPSLFESEMFGYVKGAFTGATDKHIGRIELAQYGTLFLDEIGDLVPEMQSKLLQVLESNSFERVGEAAPIGVDIRVISATNVDLPTAIAHGLLRRDLYYRLAAVEIKMPSLRERKKDIPILVDHFVHQFARQYEIHSAALSKPVIEALNAHSWPGNIRELRNVVSRILLHSLDSAVTESFVSEMLHRWQEEKALSKTQHRYASKTNEDTREKAACANSSQNPDCEETTPLSLFEHERAHLLETLQKTNWRVSGPHGAAKLLGIPRTTLQHKMRKFQLVRPMSKESANAEKT